MNVEDQQGNIIHEGVTIVTFVEEFGKTRLTVHARIERSTVEHTPTDAARMEDSWNQILDHLAKDMSESKEHLA
jgi:uncharacterized protein YndB with AHSA1/START domain